MLWPLLLVPALAAAEPTISAPAAAVAAPSACGLTVLTLDPAAATPARVNLGLAAAEMVVGARGDSRLHLGTEESATAPAPPELHDSRLRRELLRLDPGDDPRHDPLSAVDVTSFDLPQFQADVVTLEAPTGTVRPFAAIAHQYDDLDLIDRYGIGAGTKWLITPHANLGTQLLFLPHEGLMPESDLLRNDVRFMTRLEISF